MRRVGLVLLAPGLVSLLPVVCHAGPVARRLGADVRPLSQDVALRLDPRKADYSGTVAIELEVLRPTRSFELHAERMTIDSLSLVREGRPVPVSQTAAGGLLTVTADAPLAPGPHRLRIAFHNRFDTQATGLYRLETGGDAYAFTQFEADDARLAFPCWDEPAFKVRYQVELTVPAELLALANTPVEAETASGGEKTVRFRRTPPLPAYLVALAVGPFEATPIPGLSVPGRVITVKGASGLTGEAVRVTPPILAALERYFGRPYPFEKLDLVAVPEFWPGAMENPGAITFADRILLAQPDALAPEQRSRIVGYLAHELAHMWFGDLVTMQWWDDLWLNESFASWMGDKVAASAFPELGVDADGVRGAQRALRSDALPSARAMRQAVLPSDNLNDAADVLAYEKGQAVLGMVENWLGEPAFRAGVLDYLAAHAWGNATAADLWGALSRASGRDVAPVLAGFLDQAGAPLVQVEILDGGRVRLEQGRFAAAGEAPAAGLWRIPVQIAYPTPQGVARHALLLTERSQVVSLPGAADLPWVHPNAGELGYYRFSLAGPALARLVEQSSAFSVRERIGLAGHLGALVEAARLPGDEYLRLLAGFASDPDAQVAQAALDGLARVRQAFGTDALAAPFADYVRRTLRPVLARLGEAPAPGEPEAVSELRADVFDWLADAGQDAETRARAARLAAAYLADPAAVHPSLVSSVLQASAYDGDRALFDEYRRRFEGAAAPAERSRYLRALGRFRRPELADAALAYALSGPLRPQELYVIPAELGDDPAQRDRVLAWLMANYDAFAGRIPATYAAYFPYFGSGCSAERLTRTETFFSDPKHRPVGVEKTLALVGEATRECVRMREREGAAVSRFLSAAPKGR